MNRFINCLLRKYHPLRAAATVVDKFTPGLSVIAGDPGHLDFVTSVSREMTALIE
jgi:hypothetical protein